MTNDDRSSKQRLSRREMLRLTGLGAAGLVVAACAPAALPAPGAPAAATGEAPKAAAPAAAQHKLTVAWHTGGEAVNKIFGEAVELFEKANTNYTLEKIAVPWDQYMDKMLVMYASDTAPDAHTIPWGWYAVFAEKGGLLDIGPFADRDAGELKPTDLWPAAWEGMLYKGVRHALPRETMGVFIVGFNKTLFDEAGAKTPADYYEAGEWTLDKWREVAKAMTKLNGDRFEQVGGDLPVFNEGFDISLKTWGLKEGLYDEALTKINLTDPLTYEFVDWLSEVINKDKSILRPGESQEFDWMASGKQAMTYNATFSIPNWRDTWQFDWDFAPPPSGKGGFLTPAGYDFYSINAKTKDAEGAWKFLLFQSMPDMTLWWGEQMFGVPFHQSVTQQWVDSVSKNPPPSRGWTYMMDMAKASVGVVNTVAQQLYLNEWTNKIIPVFRGDKPAKEVFPALKEEIEKALAEAQPG